MLKGPTGCGKTRFVEAMAEKLRRPLVSVCCNEDTSSTDLLGRHLLEGGETVWHDGPLTHAVKQGAILYLDEIAEARSDAIVVIHSLADHRRTLFLDRVLETISAPDEFMLVASYNPQFRNSLKELKVSTQQRFVSCVFDYPDSEKEAAILIEEATIEHATAVRLVALAAKLRNLTDLSMLEPVSTRLLVSAAKLIASGLPPRLSCQMAIAHSVSDEADTIAAITHAIELII
jgi:nitric oxide reductase NorQ protein